MNGALTFVLLLVFIVMAAQVMQTWLKQRDKKSDSAEEELAETLEKLEVLEERVRVLERIITEHRIDLKQQIDDL